MWQIIRASLDDGVKEARALLHDWLVILTAQYNDYYKFAQFAQPSSSNRLDVAFSKCPQLQALPRHVFALLRSPLLRSHEEGVHPDHRIYLQCLFRYKYTGYGIYCGPHTIELVYTLKNTLRLILCVHSIYQPRGPNWSLDCFYWIENSVHFKDFQSRGGRIHHGDMTSVIRVAHYFPA